ncbi:MAG: hypothetical protein Q9222_000362 [Ikaeria aurantiellina]
MFREPEVVERKSAAKTDPTAPARSSIRRQRSVRYPSRNHRDGQASSRSRMHRYHEPPGDSVRTRERAYMGAADPSIEGAFTVETSANRAHAEASRRRRLESGRAILRDALSYEHPHESMNVERDQSYALDMMRPPNPSVSSSNHLSRRARDRPAIAATSPGDPATQPYPAAMPSSAAAYIPSPPQSSSDHSSRSSPDILQSAHGTASLTPRFPPAHPVRPPGLTEDMSTLPRYPSRQNNLAIDRAMVRGLSPQQRRNARYAPIPVHSEISAHDAFDGLGDRWRSISPDNDSWETLLSTMPPDEHLPSTSASSFRSNEDPVPYETHRNVAEVHIGAISPYPVICENTDSDSTESEEDGMADHVRLRGERHSHLIEHHPRAVDTADANQERARGLPLSHTARWRQTVPRDPSMLTNEIGNRWLQGQALEDTDTSRELRQGERPGRERL